MELYGKDLFPDIRKPLVCRKEAFENGEREKKPSLVKELNGKGKRVALLDLGAKRNIAASLLESVSSIL